MAKIYCLYCGEGTEGIGLKFCSHCAKPFFQTSTSSKPSVSLPKKQKRIIEDSESEEEDEEDSGGTEAYQFRQIAKLEVELIKDNIQGVSLQDLIKGSPDSFSRPVETRSKEEILAEFKKESSNDKSRRVDID